MDFRSPVWFLALLFAFASPRPLTAQNPTWRGQAFRLVFSEGDTLPGMTDAILAENAVLTASGIYIYSPVRRGRGDLSEAGGIFRLSEEGLSLVVNNARPEFQNVSAVTHVGRQDDGTLFFIPELPNSTFPLYRWDGSLSPVLPWQSLGNQVQIVGGSLAATRISSDAGIQVLRGPVSAPIEVLNDTTTAGLTGHWAFDGANLVFQTGSTGQNEATLWLLRADGTRDRILGNSDLLPGGTKPAGIATSTTRVFVDQGVAYVTMGSRPAGERGAQRVLFRFDGNGIEPLLAIDSTHLGLGGVPVTTFTVGSVQAGEILATATLRGGRSGVFHWKEGVWTELFSTESSFDGEQPRGFTLFPAGHQGDSLVLKVTFLIRRVSVDRLYTNARLGAIPSSSLSLQVAGAEAARLTLRGPAHTRHRLLQSTNLQTWLEHSILESTADGQAELSFPLTDPAVYFQAVPLSD